MNDNELKQFCLEFREGLIGKKSSEWMCFAASAPLQALLSSYGIETKLISGEVEVKDYTINHYWLELPDGRIIDITADQFNSWFSRKLPKVYLGEKPEWYLI